MGSFVKDRGCALRPAGSQASLARRLRRGSKAAMSSAGARRMCGGRVAQSTQRGRSPPSTGHAFRRIPTRQAPNRQVPKRRLSERQAPETAVPGAAGSETTGSGRPLRWAGTRASGHAQSGAQQRRHRCTGPYGRRQKTRSRGPGGRYALLRGSSGATRAPRHRRPEGTPARARGTSRGSAVPRCCAMRWIASHGAAWGTATGRAAGPTREDAGSMQRRKERPAEERGQCAREPTAHARATTPPRASAEGPSAT